MRNQIRKNGLNSIEEDRIGPKNINRQRSSKMSSLNKQKKKNHFLFLLTNGGKSKGNGESRGLILNPILNLNGNNCSMLKCMSCSTSCCKINGKACFLLWCCKAKESCFLVVFPTQC